MAQDCRPTFCPGLSPGDLGAHSHEATTCARRFVGVMPVWPWNQVEKYAALLRPQSSATEMTLSADVENRCIALEVQVALELVL